MPPAPALLARVSGKLIACADLLEAFGENPHRVRAYRAAVVSLNRHEDAFGARLAAGTLSALPAVGSEIAAKVSEIATTGRLARLQELQNRVPPESERLSAVPGVDLKLAVYLIHRLHVNTVAQLRQLAATHMLRVIPWLGVEGERRVRAGLVSWTEGRAPGTERPQ